MRKTIVITGGHHNSALVVAEKLKERGHRVVWMGHKYTMLGDKSPGAEFKEVTEAGFEFIEIKAAKSKGLYKPDNLLRLPWSLAQAFNHISRLKPHLILSFGGYLALPVVISGWLLKVPCLTHEQTVTYGLANRLIALFSQKVMITWRTSKKYFPSQKTILTGLPLRKAIFATQKGRFGFHNQLPTLYITGGKQGSHVINQAVKQTLRPLLENYNLIHQCGSTTIHNDLTALKNAQNRLPQQLKRRYLVQDYFFQDEIGQVFAATDLVIGRAGAHTTYEIVALAKPALLIPIPWAHADEQNKNAQLLKRYGLAEILSQKRLKPETLLKKIKAMTKRLKGYQKSALKAQTLIQPEAAEKIVKLVEATAQ